MAEVPPSPSVVRGGPQLPDPINEALSAVIKHLRDDDADGCGIIGICGADGTGKTTLLETIRDMSRGSLHELFDVVVCATVSGHGSIRRLQEDLGRRMRLFEPSDGAGGPSDTTEHAEKLFRALQRRRCLLLLDDVQEALDLASIGIPVALDHDKGCKIVFTTSLPSVCRDMGPQAKVELNPLDVTQARELFRREVGADAVFDDPLIRPLATAVADGCGGLPLALVSVGRAMPGRSSTVDWEGALQLLQDSTARLDGENKVLLSALLFSFRCLRDDRLRSCLLYCSLFPEGHDIDKEQLIEYWVGEGLLDCTDPDQSNSFSVARERGHDVIRSLQSACLLEHGCGERTKCVKLHPAVWKMALWVTSGSSDLVEAKFLAEPGKELTRVPSAERWEGSTRASLMHNKIDTLSTDLPKCPTLSTLLIRNNITRNRFGPKVKKCKLVQLPDNRSNFLRNSFFGAFPVLRVLDMSFTQLDYLPRAIGSFCELQYLNLSHTTISSLPRELGRLTKLRQLDLRHTEQLSEIPPDALSGLTALQMLNLYGSRYLRQPGKNDLKFLEHLEHLGELGISLGDLRCLGDIVRSERIHRAMVYLELFQMNGVICPNLRAAFEVCTRLRELVLEGCPQLAEFGVDEDQLPHLKVLQFRHVPRLSNITLGDHKTSGGAQERSPPLPSLSYLLITHCDSLVDLEVTGNLPCLSEVHVHNCNAIKQLLTLGVAAEEDDESSKSICLPSLSELHLRYLSSLTSICGSSSIHLPSLKAVNVKRCPVLERHPRDEAHCRLTYFELDELEGSDHGQQL